MDRTFAGIDPGFDGAVALVEPGGIVALWDAPVIKVDGKKTFDLQEMVRIISTLTREPGIEVVVEKVHSMPKQGVASSFKFGEGFGMWKGILAALGVRYHLVDPRRWSNKLLADMPKGDGASFLRASQLYPNAATMMKTERGRVLDGRSDALLLAHYGRTYL